MSAQRTVEDVFEDFRQRRNGIIKALTTDFDEFYSSCDPDRPNLCLYGHNNGTWEVALPIEEVPPEMPEPALGLNFAREGMKKQDWLAFCAVHSDAWLLGVAFFNGARFDRRGRDQLFRLINGLPSVYEVVSGRALEGAEDEALDDPEEEGVGGDDDACTECGGMYKQGEFWIQCDRCKKWYHGKCVRMTQTKAEQVQFWHCPRCKR